MRHSFVGAGVLLAWPRNVWRTPTSPQTSQLLLLLLLLRTNLTTRSCLHLSVPARHRCASTTTSQCRNGEARGLSVV